MENFPLLLPNFLLSVSNQSMKYPVSKSSQSSKTKLPNLLIYILPKSIFTILIILFLTIPYFHETSLTCPTNEVRRFRGGVFTLKLKR